MNEWIGREKVRAGWDGTARKRMKCGWMDGWNGIHG